MKKGAALVLAVAAAAPAPARAEGNRSTEVGAFLGVHTVSADTALVRLDGMPNSPPTTGVPLGLRLGWSFSDHVAVDVEGTMQYASTGDREGSGFLAAYRGLVRWRITGDRARFRPFLVVGAGGMSAYVSRPLRSDSGTIFAGTGGGGLELGIGRNLGLRLDLRVHMSDGFEGLATDVEVAVGVCWAPGGSCGWRPAPVLDEGDGGGAVEVGGKPLDSDGDGIYGKLDKCPLRAEDADGRDDEDGCPDEDDDEDGVADVEDRCPTEAENKNGYQDGDGCPEEVPAELAELEGILAGVVFRPGTTAFDKRSYDVLDRLAQTLLAHPNVLVTIVVHTSNVGEYKQLVTLSAQRADVIKQYLVDRGVNGDRIAVVGAGPDSPIADNSTAEGRAINERVELRLGR
jgi:OOP family OmpA-OmpF porin